MGVVLVPVLVLTAFRFNVIPGIAFVTVLELLTTLTPSIVRFACWGFCISVMFAAKVFGLNETELPLLSVRVLETVIGLTVVVEPSRFVRRIWYGSVLLPSFIRLAITPVVPDWAFILFASPCSELFEESIVMV